MKSPPETRKDFFHLLRDGAARLEIPLRADQLGDFDLYLRELNIWRRRINLVSRKDDREIIIKDFLDSLTIERYLSREAALLDLGSGAGFPGIPLKIVRSDLRVMLLEATRKKVFFLKDVRRRLGLEGVEIRWTEEAGGKEDLPGKFDFVVSRAFGPLLKFAPAGIGFLKKGGILLSMKSKRGKEELERSLPSLQEMNLELAFLDSIRLPWIGEERTLIGLKKG